MFLKTFYLTLFLTLLHLTTNAPPPPPFHKGYCYQSAPTPIKIPAHFYKMTFEQFLAKYGTSITVKSLGSFNMIYRKRIFEDNLIIINKHNMDKSRTYDVEVNQFAILDSSQFKKYYLNFKPNLVPNIKIKQDQKNFHSLKSSPEIINYECFGPHVQNQGKCGSCYAFSTADTIALILASQTNFYIQYSAQYIISTMDSGCEGNNLNQPYQHIIQHGIVKKHFCYYQNWPFSDALPLGGLSGCSPLPPQFPISSKHSIPGGCNNVLNVLRIRPIAVGMYLYEPMQYAANGMFQITPPPLSQLNHAVILIGYNSDYGFKFKNSWGAQWKEGGFGWVDKLLNGGVCSYAVDVTFTSFIDWSKLQKCEPCQPNSKGENKS